MFQRIIALLMPYNSLKLCFQSFILRFASGFSTPLDVDAAKPASRRVFAVFTERSLLFFLFPSSNNLVSQVSDTVWLNSNPSGFQIDP